MKKNGKLVVIGNFKKWKCQFFISDSFDLQNNAFSIEIEKNKHWDLHNTQNYLRGYWRKVQEVHEVHPANHRP